MNHEYRMKMLNESRIIDRGKTRQESWIMKVQWFRFHPRNLASALQTKKSAGKDVSPVSQITCILQMSGAIVLCVILGALYTRTKSPESERESIFKGPCLRKKKTA